jgi:hypothetical protein
MIRPSHVLLPIVALAVGLGAVAPSAHDDGQRLLTIDHYVRHTSNVPAMNGQLAQIYVRERVSAGVALRGAAAPDKVVLFVHGAGTPAEPSTRPSAAIAGWRIWRRPGSTCFRWTRPATAAPRVQRP